jgi:hypothetical protein
MLLKFTLLSHNLEIVLLHPAVVINDSTLFSASMKQAFILYWQERNINQCNTSNT